MITLSLWSCVYRAVSFFLDSLEDILLIKVSAEDLKVPTLPRSDINFALLSDDEWQKVGELLRDVYLRRSDKLK